MRRTLEKLHYARYRQELMLSYFLHKFYLINSPAITIDSLFANKICLPIFAASIVEIKPALPVIAATTVVTFS